MAADEVRFNVCPAQIGLLEPEAAVGNTFTVAEVVATAEQPPLLVTVTEYVPVASAVAEMIEGFCCDEVNPFGPDQL